MTDPQQVLEEQTATRRTGGLAGDAAVVVLAVVAALVTWAVVGPVAGVELRAEAGDGSREVGGAAVAATALVVALAGVLLARVLARGERGLRWWTVVASVVWALSVAGPLGATTAAAGAGLACLHLVVGAVVVFGVRRLHGRRTA